MFKMRASKFLRKLFWIDVWNIGIVSVTPKSIIEKKYLPEPIWLSKNRAFKFKADPFFITLNNKLYILYEDFNFLFPKGKINLMDLNGNIVKKNIFSESFHLSYPFTFKDGDKQYVIPESAESGNISIYQLNSEDFSVKDKKILIDDFSGVDNTLFKFGEIFWIFCTNGAKDDCEQLYAWHSKSLFSEWAPHVKNPIKVSKRSARPGGRPFFLGGSLYRPSQNCENHYGKSIIINKIIQLTPEKFDECEELELKPSPDSSYSFGMHHIDMYDNLAIVDSKASRFSLIALPLKILQRFFIGYRKMITKYTI